jgi:N-acetylglutamate synthase
MQIRLMAEDDYPEVYALWKATPGIGLRSLDDSEEGFARFVRRNPDSCFVAVDKGIAGVILCGQDGRRGHIYHMAVAGQMRRKGVGTALVNCALDALRAQGITRVKLEAFSENAEGNAFWESMGFFCRSDLITWNKSLSDENE